MSEVQRRTGGRSARVRSAVLQAAVEALAEPGSHAVSMNEIARRAGVHATSVQRRWGSREKLMLDAMLTYSQQQLPIPDTGSLREDLIAFARSIAAYLTAPLGGSLARTMAATDDDPALRAGRADFWQARYDAARVIVDGAVDRHEVPADTDPRLMLEMLISPVHFRQLLTRTPTSDDHIERLVDVLVRGFGSAG